MNKPLVYLAGPYSKGDVAQNVYNALRLADYIVQTGEAVPYVPHLTHFWHMMFPQPYEWWLEYDLIWLEKCDALIRIAGESGGADKEVVFANKKDLPCFLLKGYELQSLSELDRWLCTLKPSDKNRTSKNAE